jgi:cytochrome c5
MTEMRYVVNVAVILGVSIVLMLFIFLLVGHHRHIPDRVRLDRGVLLGNGSSADERIKPVAQVNVASAETQREPVKNAVAAPPASRNGQQIYQATCVACHDAGIAGAPKLGDKSQWAKHIAKGRDTLYASAVNGVHGSTGAMPPKGGNPALSDAEVRAAVDYMVARSK